MDDEHISPPLFERSEEMESTDASTSRSCSLFADSGSDHSSDDGTKPSEEGNRLPHLSPGAGGWTNENERCSVVHTQLGEGSGRIKLSSAGARAFVGGSPRRTSILRQSPKEMQTFVPFDSWKQLREAPWTVEQWGMPHSISVAFRSRGIAEMYPWQRACLYEFYRFKHNGQQSNLVYSAPTSGGKSFVSEFILIDCCLSANRKGMMIVPYVALAEEKTALLSELLVSTGKTVVCHAARQGFRTIAGDIHVCTTEKGNTLLSTFAESDKIEELCCVVVDELHLLVEEHRGYVLELLLTKLVDYCSKGISICLVGMSATLSNGSSLARWLDGAHLFLTDFRPVPLSEYFVVENVVFDTSGKQVRVIENNIFPGGISANNAFIALALEGILHGFQCLVFCPSRRGCEISAQAMCAKLLGSTAHEAFEAKHELRLSASRQLRAIGTGAAAGLASLVEKGVGFHHAHMLSEEKRRVETAFREGSIWILFCTTTLSSGVNLPARRAIFNSPRIANSILEVAQYRQAAGRAGRAGLDDSGESFLCGRKCDRGIMESLVRACLPPLQTNFSTDKKGMMRVLLEGISIKSIRSTTDVHDYINKTFFAASSDYAAVEAATCKALDYLEANSFIEWLPDPAVFAVTQLGSATVNSSLAPDEALLLFQILSKARTNLVIGQDLSLVNLCTPIFPEVETNWSLLLRLYNGLNSDELHVANNIGISAGYISACSMFAPTKVDLSMDAIIHRRFFASLMLLDICHEHPLFKVSEKFGCSRSELQRLMEAAAYFSSMSSSFCETLNWWFFPPLLDVMGKRLERGVEQDILPLMQIDSLAPWRARELYKKGFRTVMSVAMASHEEIAGAIQSHVQFHTTDDLAAREAKIVSETVNTIQTAAREALKRQADEMKESIRMIDPADAVGPPQLPQQMNNQLGSSPAFRGQASPPLASRRSEKRARSTLGPAAPVARKLLRLERVDFGKESDVAKFTEATKKLQKSTTGTVKQNESHSLVAVALASASASSTIVIIATDDAVFELRHNASEGNTKEKLRNWIMELFENESVIKVFRNAKEDLKLFVNARIINVSDLYQVKSIFDPMVADWMLSPDDREGGRQSTFESLIKNHQVPDEFIPFPAHDNISKAAFRGAQLTSLARRLREKLKINEIVGPFVEIEMPLVPVLARMELNSLHFRCDIYEEYARQMHEKINILRKEAYLESACRDWDLSSRKDCARILFDVLEMPSLESTASTKYFPSKKKSRRVEAETRSTKSSVLIALQQMFPTAKMPLIIQEFRTMQGWLSKYIHPLLNEARSNGKIQGIFLQTATATGRLAMEEPNLQTIPKPISFSLGERQVPVAPRRAFVANPNCLLMSADYCQIEVRILAHFSQDETFLSAFRSGIDVFVSLAAKLHHNGDFNKVTPTERQQAKTLCYGMIYGKGKNAIAEELDILVPEAEKILSEFKNKYRSAMNFISNHMTQVKRSGFVETIGGRRRWLPYVNSSNDRARSASERQAINTLCQGSAADIVKVAMINAEKEVQSQSKSGEEPLARLLVQIHDELLFEVKQGSEHIVGRIVQQSMLHSYSRKLSVELPVKLRIGPNWAELEEFSPV